MSSVRVRQRMFLALTKCRFSSLARRLRALPGVVSLYRRIRAWTDPGVVTFQISGFELNISTADDVILPTLLREATWEPLESELFVRSLSAGMVVADIGAHVGYYALLAARCVGPSGRVFAFEPDPENFRLLCRNVVVNGLSHIIVPVPVALAETSGHRFLYRDKHNSGGSSFSCHNVERPAGRVFVKTITLSEFLTNVGYQRLDVVKIDVQGAEGLVLEGMGQLLKQPSIRIFMELWPNGLRRLGTDPKALLERLLYDGFQIYAIQPQRRLIRATSADHVLQMCPADSSMNLLLTKGEV